MGWSVLSRQGEDAPSESTEELAVPLPRCPAGFANLAPPQDSGMALRPEEGAQPSPTPVGYGLLWLI